MAGRSSCEWTGEDEEGSDSSWVPDDEEQHADPDDDDEVFDGWFDCEETHDANTKKDYHKPVGRIEAESRLGDMLCKKLLEGPWDATDVCELAFT